jgi:hypothetical protein
MDPLTTLSVAGTVVQFVDFGSKIIRGGIEVYKSANGKLLFHEELEFITRDLTALTTKLSRPLRPTNPTALTKTETALEKLCDSSNKAAEDLLLRLDKLKIEGEHRAWKSVRHAIKASWAQDEIDTVLDRLSRFKEELELHILVGLR